MGTRVECLGAKEGAIIMTNLPKADLAQLQAVAIGLLPVKVRVDLAALGLFLEELAGDSSPLVRSFVASHGLYTSLLAVDPSPLVRASVADSGHALDKLAHDPSPMVRATVAQARKELM